MAHPTSLTTTGRTDLDRPPAPTTPPEAAPRIAQLAASEEGEGNAASIGSLQQSSIIFQTGMAVEKGLIALANLMPGFAQLAEQIIPQIRSGITQGLSSSGSPTPGGATNELPAQAVSPLQQG